MEIGFTELMQLLMLASGVFVFWLAHRSFPPKETGELIMSLKEASAKTKTQADDILIEIAMLLNEMRQREDETVIEVLGDEGGELSTK